MRSKVTAALLSGLVFPGVGQWYLGRRPRALLFLVPAFVGGGVYGSHALQAATSVADKVLGGDMPLDPIAIAAQLDALPVPVWVTVAGTLFVVCWVGSVAEAVLVGNRQGH
jgi:hypothetical protein